jgi:hypothetical protein
MVVLDPLNAPWNLIVLTLLCVGFPMLVASIAYMLEKAERLKPDLPVVLVHVWDPTLRIEWTWLELVKQNTIAELRLKDEPTPYLVTPLDIWKPLTELRSRIQRRPATSIADLMPGRR